MPTASTITPAKVEFTIGKEETPIIDAKLNIKITNNCHYTECILAGGIKGYMLVKGPEIMREGELKVQTAKTGDGKGDEAIETLRKKQELTQKHDNPDYNQDIMFSVSTAGNNNFVNIGFKGFVKEYREFDPVGTAPPKQEADIELYDPTTLNITKGKGS